MGADITFYKLKKNSELEELFYLRDSYNDYNLAWVSGLSYWEAGIKSGMGEQVEKAIEFLQKSAEVTDKDIQEYVEDKKLPKKYFKEIKKKRDYLREHMKELDKAVLVRWNV